MYLRRGVGFGKLGVFFTFPSSAAMDIPKASNPSNFTMNKNKNKKQKKYLDPASKLHSDLQICCKNKDLSGAISLYESALTQKIRLNQPHFNILLYICSKSITDSTKNLSVDQGFRIFDHMLSNKIDPNEATITAVSRLAAAKGDGDLAFELVKGMGNKYRDKPRLRSYDPALLCFCEKLDAEKAYLVEEHIVSMGLQVEEQEVAALLRVSVETGKEEKVYEYLHKLRGVVRCVSESTGGIIENWFGGEVAGEVGMVDWDAGRVKEAVSRNGGGWHGLGWLGKGKWVVKRSNVEPGGCCSSCREQLACVDIDRMETEKFAQSVASLALERESQSNFTEFQKWLDQHSEFEAIVDGANIGLYQQNFAEGGFSISQLDLVVKELYNRTKKWPLVILHKKRVRALLENASNRELLEEWMHQGLLYGTPFGSNDDWYWLYAAVKLKCVLVTNDEMRDHIFELLGSSFFPRWKERHHVRYTFVKGNLKLQMPPSYSLVIQESEKGTWHVPLGGECNDESKRSWLCVTRPGFCKASEEVVLSVEASETRQLPSTASNGLYGSGNGIHSFDSETMTITGKRKERSPPRNSDHHQ